MKYNIWEAKIKWQGGRMVGITVLVEMSTGDVRRITATDKPKAGYTHIDSKDELNEALLQRVAGQGFEEF